MYNNVGRKIKTCAKVFAIIFIVLVTILGWVAVLDIEEPIALIILPIGYFISWISFISMYAFGQLVENSDKMVALQKENNKLLRLGLFETEE